MLKTIRLWIHRQLVYLGFLPNETITKDVIETYAEFYFKFYQRLANRIHIDEYRKLLYLQQHQHYNLHCIISKKRGALIEFIPSERTFFSSQIVRSDIMKYFFYLNSKNKPKNTKVKFKNTINAGKRMNESLFQIDSQYNTFSKLAFKTNGKGFIKLGESGSVTLREIDFNGILFENQILLKGSNKVKDWSVFRKVRRDVQMRFANDLRFAFHESKEFREYLATPALSKEARKIILKEKNGKYSESYGVLEYDKDLKRLRSLALKMDVETEFIDTVLQFVRTKNSRPNFMQRNPIVVRVVGGIILYVLTQVFNWKWIMKTLKSLFD
mgnify:CR=1 FL=1